MVKKAAPEVPDINWDLITPSLIEAFTPIIQGVTWLGLSKIDPKVTALNNLIAVAEIVPTIDLGLPKGIVLAAMYDKTDEALDMINQLAQAITDLPGDLKNFIQNVVDEAKEAIVSEITPDIIEETEIQERKPGESWQDFIERRLRETGLFGR